MTTIAEPVDQDWIAFRSALERAIGVPLYQYKEPQMKRRLASVMTRNRIESWAQFTTAIATDKNLRQVVQDTLTINVSEFFRQSDRFLDLRDTVLPALMKERGTVKLWSAGCSIGCEPYTLAILLDELDPTGRHQVLATDVDMPALGRAREGSGYLPNEVRAVPPDYLAKYFRFDGATYRVDDRLKRRVTFRRHDLLSDRYPDGLDLILCRNVVIYFNDEAKKHIYAGFSQALRPGGLLFIGGSEMIMRPADLGLKTAGTSFYRKAA